jgi:4-amino-4-deoxy-L-arabinose transferase-like glycosyltransferase
MLLLVASTFGLLWLLIVVHRRAIGFGNLSIRGALVLAFLAFELLLLVITELTSVGHNFTFGVVAGVWGVLVIVLLVAARNPLRRLANRAGTEGGFRARVRGYLDNLSVEDRIWLGVLVAIFGILIAIGFEYLPSNSDSLVYHLARVEHWIQNRTVAPFATHYLPQIEFPPLSEYNLALLHLLSGTDRFDAGMSLLAAVVSVVGASELARLLGGTRSVQIVAAVVCATIPSGVLLATSTENDYFTAAIGVGVLIILVSLATTRRWKPVAIALGIATGLAFMAKTTTPLMIGPTVLILLVVALRRLRPMPSRRVAIGRGVALVATTAVCAVIVIAPFAVQNVELFGSPFGPSSANALSSPLTADAGAANVLRSTANNFHFGGGASGLDSYVSRFSLDLLGHAFNLFHIAQSDSRYSVTPSYQAFTVGDYAFASRSEGLGANPWDVILLMTSLVVLVVAVRRGAKNLRISLLLASGLTAGYLLFTFTAKWGIYNARYSLPLLVAWSSLIAIALSQFPRWVGRFVMIALLVACIPQLFDNATRPLVRPPSYASSYLEPYFIGCCNANLAEQTSSYELVTASLAQSTCTRAALQNWVLFEYPLWVGLNHDHWTGVLNDVDVHNQTAKLEPSDTSCAWISQQGSHYITPDNGTVNMERGDLALSIDANRASTVGTAIPGFGSTVTGVHVLPGGGWSLEGLSPLAVLVNRGSLYVTSTTSRRVQLQLQLLHGYRQPSLTVSEPGGGAVAITTGPKAIHADLALHAGSNRFNLVLRGTSDVRFLVLDTVAIGPG